MNKSHFGSTVFFVVLISFYFGCSQEDVFLETSAPGEVSAFDEKLAEELGADNYGMKTWVLALLKAGPNRDYDRETALEIQRGHMANINRLADEGKLILAGPFLTSGELRGIFLFDVETVEEARELTETDPAIQAGSLVMELHPWYGSAALLKVPEIHKRIAAEQP